MDLEELLKNISDQEEKKFMIKCFEEAEEIELIIWQAMATYLDKKTEVDNDNHPAYWTACSLALIRNIVDSSSLLLKIPDVDSEKIFMECIENLCRDLSAHGEMKLKLFKANKEVIKTSKPKLKLVINNFNED